MTQSKACQTCKTRRIKCDEGTPTCLRCIKSRRECVRPDVSSFAIVSENEYADGATKRPRGPRLRKVSPQTIGTSDLRSEALKYYLEYHVIPPTDNEVDICGSLSACVVAWQTGGDSSTMVDLALSSMALAVYARTRSSPQAAAEAYANYHQLLRLLQEHIARPTLDTKSVDACLLTVFFMGRCESTMYQAENLEPQGGFKGGNAWSHHDGALALLRLWHMHLRHETVSIIVRQSRRGMLKSLLLRGLPVPKWLADGSCFGEEGAGLRYDRILARLVNLRSVLRTERNSDDQNFGDDLMAEAAQLAQDLRGFTTELPESYSYRKCAAPTPDRDWIQGSMLNMCSTPEHATTWAHLFATRLIITHTNIQVFQFIPQTKEEAETHTITLREVAEDLAATIPQCLELVHTEDHLLTVLPQDNLKPWQASRAVWPLTIAVSVPGYNEALQQGFKSQLATIGKIVGDGVLQTVTTDEWPLI